MYLYEVIKANSIMELKRDPQTGVIKIVKDGILYFEGTEQDLCQLAVDTMEFAIAVESDVAAGNINDEDSPNLCVETYLDFANKYSPK